jgi:hypothetical protein
MRLLVTRHIGYHIFPAVVFMPSSSLLGGYLSWSVTLWWGTLGLMLVGAGDRSYT